MFKGEKRRNEIYERIDHLADLFLVSGESYEKTCEKYGCDMEETATLFCNILVLYEPHKVTLLCLKYPYLREWEDAKIFHK